MLYFFKVLDSPWVKFGWTEQADPWNRIQTGFWSNVHPDELCQKGDPERAEKLAPSNLNLIFLFDGDSKLESVIKSLFPPDCGEFWKEQDLESMVQMLKLMCEELPIPARPQFHPCDDVAKRACCTGKLIRCFTCGKNFKSFDKLFQHKRDVHEPGKFSCSACGRKFARKDRRDKHVQNSCKGKR